jgi:hypothetical protein
MDDERRLRKDQKDGQLNHEQALPFHFRQWEK